MKRTLFCSFVLLVLFCGTTMAAPFAYVNHHWEGTVSVVDTATDTVTATIQIGAAPIGIAVSPSGTRVYVAKDHTTELAVIDTATNTVAATVQLPYNDPIGVAVNPAGTRVYVSNGWGENISVVDTATNTVIANIPHEYNPGGLDVTPDGTKLYVGTAYSDFVALIDTATNTLIADIPVGNDTTGIAIDPSGTKAYVARRGNNTVCVLDIATSLVTATIPVGSAPTGIVVNPSGTKVYVTNYGDNTVSVIDTASNTVIATITAETSPLGVSVTPDGTRVYVTHTGSDAVLVIDTATDTVVRTFPTGAPSHNFGKFIGPAMTIRDATAPVTTAAVSGTPGSNGTFTSDVQVAITAIDPSAGSGVREIHYVLDGTPHVVPVVANSTTTIAVSGEGTHTLSFWSVDNAFNIEQAQPALTITIDLRPTVTGTSPLNGATGVGRASSIVVTFSKEVGEGSAYSGIVLKRGSTTIPATKTLSGTTLTIAPATMLEPGTTYKVTIPATAVVDAAGNGMETAYILNFKTGTQQ